MIYIVMGGQCGSEGKGEFVSYFASKLHDKGTLGAVVRTGGPNAGHTMTYNGIQYKMRQIPCAWHLPNIPLCIGPGSLLDLDVLKKEVVSLILSGDENNGRLMVDGSALVITQEDRDKEQALVSRVGSTAEGIGSARSNHAMRQATLAKDSDDFHSIITDTYPVSDFLNSVYDQGKDIIIESTQGFDLSLIHSGHYPFTTSRDITPGQILNDAGLSSRLRHQVISVIRTFPIRVAGNSGPMAGETSWSEIGVDEEYTTVTGRTRRVGKFDPDQIKRMDRICRPDSLCVGFLDYLCPELKGCTDPQTILSHDQAYYFLRQVDKCTQATVRWVGTGPGIITEL